MYKKKKSLPDSLLETALQGPNLVAFKLIELAFNYTSTLVGHFVLSPREREKRDRRDSYSGDEREEQGRKWKMNESEETE